MSKELKIVKIIEELKKKAESAKIEKARYETAREVFSSQAKESAEAIISLTNSKDLKEAFSKLMSVTKLEVELESTFNKIADCYNNSDFDDFDELVSKAKELAGKIEEILGKDIVEDKKESELDVEEDPINNEPNVEEDNFEDGLGDKDETEDEIKKETTKKKIIVEDDDEEDEDI